MNTAPGNRQATDPLTHWLDKAGELGIYVRYTLEREGAGPLESSGQLTALLDAVLGAAVTACSNLEPGDRWMTVSLDSQPDRVLLELTAPGPGPPGLPAEHTRVIRYDDSYRLRLELRQANV